MSTCMKFYDDDGSLSKLENHVMKVKYSLI